ncbi:TrbI/VirB10 family protein, partial [Escherichia coli]|uniref:TrbI/VirB10 family protein n=1 Tax=Escherichia coli TaxID=562 RepID=UPI0025464CB7
LGSMPGADMAGYSGFRDQVHNHSFRIFGNALLLSGITATIAYSQDRDQNNNNSNQAPNMSSEMSAALGQVFGQAIAQVVQKNLNIAPTLASISWSLKTWHSQNLIRHLITKRTRR